MQNVADIFAAWPSDAEFGRDIGVPYPTVSAWKQRESIPAAYWWHIIRAAAQRGHPEITADLQAISPAGSICVGLISRRRPKSRHISVRYGKNGTGDD